MRDRDDQIDAMYTSLFRELLTYMMEDPRNITPCTHLLFCAKNIERIGDHATNIAETIYYVVTGEQMPIERPKEDKSHNVVLSGDQEGLTRTPGFDRRPLPSRNEKAYAMSRRMRSAGWEDGMGLISDIAAAKPA